MPRKPDLSNSTALISDKPLLSAAVKEVASLRKKFLNYFTDGINLGYCVLAVPSEVHVSSYLLDDRLLTIVLNDSDEPKQVTLDCSLGLWTNGLQNYTETLYDGKGQAIRATPASQTSPQKVSIGTLQPLELAFIECRPGKREN